MTSSTQSFRYSPWVFIKIVFTLLLIFQLKELAGQEYKFTHISSEKGLPQKYVYDMLEDKKGYLWIATGEGLCSYDGIEIKTYNTTQGLTENFVTKIFLAANGDMWIGHNKGGTTIKTKTGFRKNNYTVSEPGPVVDFLELPGNCILTACQNGKIIITNKTSVKIYPISKNGCTIHSMQSISNKEVLFFTSEGCYVASLKDGKFLNLNNLKRSDLAGEKIQTSVKDNVLENVLWMGTASGKLLRGVITNGTLRVNTVNCSEDINAVHEIVQAQNGTLWMGTYNGVYHVRYNAEGKSISLITHYSDKNGLPSNFVKSLLFDSEDNLWLGLYGEGLAMLKDEFFTLYHYDEPSLNDIKTMLVFKNETWAGVKTGLIHIDNNQREKHQLYTPPQKNKSFSIVAICDGGNNVVVGTSADGVYVFNKTDHSWKQQLFFDETLLNEITDIKKLNNEYWIGTRGGLIVADEKIQLLKLWSTQTGLPHNNVNCVFIDNKSNVWISTPGNHISRLANNRLENIEVNKQSLPIEISCITKDRTGKLWIGTSGNGIIVKDGNVLQQLTVSNGLKSDYIYSIISGNNDDIWVGHRGSLSCINANTLKADVFDHSFSIQSDFNPLATHKDSTGNIWFGTNHGLLMFDRSKFRITKTPPKINLQSVSCSDKILDILKPAELAYGSYKVKFNFVGISLSHPEKVRYQYYLEGFDISWSEFSEKGSATYSKLEDGNYKFKVRAINADGFESPEMALFNITIQSPFWKTWWFLLLCIFLLLLSFSIYIRIRERTQQRRLNLLESKLAERTQELVKQKSLVELKNKDITDSIYYALRIQTSILPDVNMLKAYLPESFILYKPRDIVSGDFYWFIRKNDRLVIACVDCTGHGVPGAFMSMIGHTLFNDILLTADEKDPASILFAVENKMCDLLHNDINDGMDLILLSLDLTTGELIFSGAMRPLLHISDNIPLLHRTGKDSIGGSDSHKNFTNQTLQLKEGDTVYVYTDGYTDQFGGPKGRKLNTSGFVNHIDQIHEKPMAEQKDILSTFFEDWKGHEPQTDDVLLMAFKYKNVYPFSKQNF